MLRFIQDDGSHSSALESCLVDLAQFCRIIECGVFSSPFFLLPGRVIGIFSQLLEGDLVVFGAIEGCAIRWPGFQQQERDRGLPRGDVVVRKLFQETRGLSPPLRDVPIDESGSSCRLRLGHRAGQRQNPQARESRARSACPPQPAGYETWHTRFPRCRAAVASGDPGRIWGVGCVSISETPQKRSGKQNRRF
jgi:hypothetical protein